MSTRRILAPIALVVGLATAVPTAAQTPAAEDLELEGRVRSLLACLVEGAGPCDLAAWTWEPACLEMTEPRGETREDAIEACTEPGTLEQLRELADHPELLPQVPLEVQALRVGLTPRFDEAQRDALEAERMAQLTRQTDRIAQDPFESELQRRHVRWSVLLETTMVAVPYRCRGGICGAMVVQPTPGVHRVVYLERADSLIYQMRRLERQGDNGIDVPDNGALLAEFEAIRDELQDSCALFRRQAMNNVDAIRTAMKAFDAEFDVMLPVERCPAEIPAGRAVPWPEACRDATRLGQMEWNAEASSGFKYSGTVQTFAHLGWEPDGRVCCSYEVTVTQTGPEGTRDFEARATCDTDGDGVPAVFVSSNKEKPKQLTGDEVR